MDIPLSVSTRMGFTTFICKHQYVRFSGWRYNCGFNRADYRQGSAATTWSRIDMRLQQITIVTKWHSMKSADVTNKRNMHKAMKYTA